MKKLIYALLGAAAAAVAVKLVLDRRERRRVTGALPRPLPDHYDGEVMTAIDELRGPLAEI